MTCRQSHLKLLRVPQIKRNAQWHTSLAQLIRRDQLVCAECQQPFFTNHFKDEPANLICINCRPEN